MPIAHDESDPMGPGVKMPVMLCGELIDQPAVRAAIATAIKELGPEYVKAAKVQAEAE